MVGGAVIEVIILPDKIWVNTIDPKRLDDRCAIYVERTPQSEQVKPNDRLWWQGEIAYWTPKENRKPLCDHQHHYSCSRAGIDYDIQLPRIGFSGVKKPVLESQKGKER